MSRAYWIKLSSSVSESIHASDKATHKIDLEEVVPQGEMRDIVSQALEDSGWTQSPDNEDQYEKKLGDVTMTWDLASNQVEATLEARQDVEKDVNVEGRAYSQDAAKREASRLLQQREQQARDQISAEEEALQRKLTQALEAGEQDRVREINEVLQKAYADALKRKARRLGNILSVQESTSEDGDYQLTITVAE
jgi:hypothetical protein